MSRRQEAEAAPWTVWVLTLYPSMFPGPLGYSLAGKALEQGLWRLETVDIRDYARDKHRTVDEAPFGGGPGMVMRADVLAAAVEGPVPEPAGAFPCRSCISGRAAGRSIRRGCASLPLGLA